MNISKYPDDFFSFKTGVDIKDKEINSWIKDCINTLEQDKNEDYAYVCTGNSIVFVFKHESKNYPEQNRYEIFVSKNYSSETLYYKDM